MIQHEPDREPTRITRRGYTKRINPKTIRKHIRQAIKEQANPTTTGEWTVERIEDYLGKCNASHAAVLANAINAELAAKGEK